MKIAIVGGGGRVGATAAYALQWAGLGDTIALIDVNQTLAEGEALDLQHGAAGTTAQKFCAGDTALAADADYIVITAGSRRRPDESRLELLDRNVVIFRDILDALKKIPLAQHCVYLIVSNPVDILTWVAVQESGLPPERVIGLGTMLDTLRLRSLLGQHFQVDPRQVNALFLGEHGDSMVPILSTAAVNGTCLTSLPGYTDRAWQTIVQRTRSGGAEVLRKKGGAGYAVGVAIVAVLRSLARNENGIIPVSTLQTGYLGMRNVCLSIPTILGSDGVRELVTPKLWPKEERALQHSAEILYGTLDRLRAAG